MSVYFDTEIDIDAGLLVLSGRPFGPAGAFDLELDELEISLRFDACSLDLVGATAPILPDARIDPAVRAALEGVGLRIGADPGAGEPGEPGRVKLDLDRGYGARQALARLAFVRGTRELSPNPESPLWDLEDATFGALAEHELGLTGGLAELDGVADAVALLAASPTATARLATVAGRDQLGQALVRLAQRVSNPPLAEALQDLAAELGGLSGAEQEGFHAEVEAYLIEASVSSAWAKVVEAVVLGGEENEAAPTRVPVGAYLIDPRTVVARALDASTDLVAMFEHSPVRGATVMVSAAVGSQAKRVGTVWARILRASDLCILGMAPLHVDPSTSRATARVLVAEDVDVDDLWVEVTSTPAARPSPPTFVAVRRAYLLGHRALRAERRARANIGRWRPVVSAWQLVADAWHEAGDRSREGLSLLLVANAARHAGGLEGITNTAETQALTLLESWAANLVAYPVQPPLLAEIWAMLVNDDGSSQDAPDSGEAGPG